MKPETEFARVLLQEIICYPPGALAGIASELLFFGQLLILKVN